MNRALTLLCLVPLLAACGKAAEKASEKMAEQAIENAMREQGAEADVDLSDEGVRMATTDAAGRTTTFEAGTATITEADVGVPFYPGAELMPGNAVRSQTPGGESLSIGLHSADPADKVAAYYREQLRSRAAGRQFMDIGTGEDGYLLMLGEHGGQHGVQVAVQAAESGTDIQIMATKPAAAG